MNRLALVLIVACCGCSSLRASEVAVKPQLKTVKTIAVLPFENITAEHGAGTVAARQVGAALSGTRWQLVDAQRLEIAHGRVDPPPASAADRLIAIRVGELLEADAVVYGTVAESTPETLGLSIRMVEVSSGRVIFSGTYSATGRTGIDELSAKAASAMASRVAP